jgi:arsenate reductase
VVTVCDSALEVCPFFPGEKEIRKSYPDTAAFEGSEEEVLSKVRFVRDDIKDWVVKSFCKGNGSEVSRLEYV